MGKITKFAKAQAKNPPMPMMKPKASKAAPVDIPPPASESEVPDAAPVVPPVQATSTPKMVSAPKSGLSMRKPFKA